MLLRHASIPGLVCLAVLVNGELRSQSLTWTDVNSVDRSNIQCLLIRPSGETFAGDDSGRVLTFRAGEIDWSRTSLPTTLYPRPTVNALTAHPNGHLFAVAGPGVYASTDGGTHWVSISSSMSPTGPIQRAVAVTPGGVLVSGGGRGVVYRSTNEGVNWSTRGITGIEISSLLSLDAGNLFLGSTKGIYRSTNHGANWTVADSALISRDVRALARDSDGRLFAATDTGAYFSPDTGHSWTRGSGLPAAHAICALPGGDLLAGNGTSELFRSTDHGSTWASVGVAPAINARCLAVGDNGAVEGGTSEGLYMSTEVATTWTKMGLGLSGGHLTAVGATPVNLVVATSDSVIYTALIGEPWTRVEGPPSGTALRCLTGISITTFLAGTSGSGVFRSVDGGKTWE